MSMASSRDGANLGDGGIELMMGMLISAPVGAVATFEIELDEITQSWQIRPTPRPA